MDLCTNGIAGAIQRLWWQLAGRPTVDRRPRWILVDAGRPGAGRSGAAGRCTVGRVAAILASWVRDGPVGIGGVVGGGCRPVPAADRPAGQLGVPALTENPAQQRAARMAKAPQATSTPASTLGSDSLPRPPGRHRAGTATRCCQLSSPHSFIIDGADGAGSGGATSGPCSGRERLSAGPAAAAGPGRLRPRSAPCGPPRRPGARRSPCPCRGGPARGGRPASRPRPPPRAG